jgi:hypothetical protein
MSVASSGYMRLQNDEDSGLRLSSNDETPFIRNYRPPQRIMVIDDEYISMLFLEESCKNLKGVKPE